MLGCNLVANWLQLYREKLIELDAAKDQLVSVIVEVSLQNWTIFLSSNSQVSDLNARSPIRYSTDSSNLNFNLNLEQPRSLTDNLKRELASQFRDPSQFY
jgi:hypothetical protein